MLGFGPKQKPLILRVQSMDRAQELMQYCDSKGWKVIVGVEPDKPEDISDLQRKQKNHSPIPAKETAGRNDLCPCGSGKKYKKCCLLIQ